MGWDDLWLDDDHNVVQIGSNNKSSSCSDTLGKPQPGDTVIWLMTSLYSFFPLHLHTAYT